MLRFGMRSDRHDGRFNNNDDNKRWRKMKMICFPATRLSPIDDSRLLPLSRSGEHLQQSLRTHARTDHSPIQSINQPFILPPPISPSLSPSVPSYPPCSSPLPKHPVLLTLTPSHTPIQLHPTQSTKPPLLPSTKARDDGVLQTQRCFLHN